MHKRKLITFTGKAFHTDKDTATWHAYADSNSKKGYGPMIGYSIISIDYDFTDTGNGWSVTCTQVYKSNRVPKHLRIENALEREKKIVSKVDKKNLDLGDLVAE